MKKTTKGFTIIEVVLVLAIAGLIFLVVFLALPALQRQQRDTQRRSDASRVLTAVQNWQSNNGGKVPTNSVGDMATLKNNYVRANSSEEFNDPNGTPYALTAPTWTSPSTGTVPANTIYYYPSAKCSGEQVLSGSANQAAVRVALENGGSYCVSNAN